MPPWRDDGQRIDHARRLLETTDWPVDRVAHRAGFGTGVSLRQYFHAAVGVTPQAYRRTFRPVPAAVPDRLIGAPPNPVRTRAPVRRIIHG